MSKRRRPARADATGRSTREAKHARVYLWEAQTAAYRSLSCGARALLIEMKLLFNGANNGDIGMGERLAAELLNVRRQTVRGYLRELEDRGFIRPAQRGSFHLKLRHATTWILTGEPYNGQPATKDFARWGQLAAISAEGLLPRKITRTKTVPDRDENRPRSRPRDVENAPDRDENRPCGAPYRPSDGDENRPTTSLPSTLASGRAAARERAVPEGDEALSEAFKGVVGGGCPRRHVDNPGGGEGAPVTPDHAAPADAEFDAALRKAQPYLGRALAELRERRGVPIEDVAAAVGVRRDAWARIEGGVGGIQRPLKRRARAALVNGHDSLEHAR